MGLYRFGPEDVGHVFRLKGEPGEKGEFKTIEVRSVSLERGEVTYVHSEVPGYIMTAPFDCVEVDAIAEVEHVINWRELRC